MAVDHIRYDILAQEALRGVVRTVLGDAAKNGLPGDHHFYVTFLTTAEGVRMPPRLLAQFPEEMTIVLQHQFWDLHVNETGFEVGMSFGGIPELLGVPFAAIKGFADPSVQFALQFETMTAEQTAASTDGKQDATRPAAEHTPAAVTIMPVAANAVPEKPDDGPDRPAGGAEVVRLDRFRKK